MAIVVTAHTAALLYLTYGKAQSAPINTSYRQATELYYSQVMFGDKEALMVSYLDKVLSQPLYEQIIHLQSITPL